KMWVNRHNPGSFRFGTTCPKTVHWFCTERTRSVLHSHVDKIVGRKYGSRSDTYVSLTSAQRAHRTSRSPEETQEGPLGQAVETQTACPNPPGSRRAGR